MENVLKENIFVMTRNKLKDYHWLCKPTYLEERILLPKMEQVFSQLSRKSKIFTSEWYSLKFGDNYEIIFRVVVDGRTDDYGRLIRRYEGAFVASMDPNVVATLEKYLLEIQNETNNYGYGFKDSLQTENRGLDKNRELKKFLQ